MASEDSSYMPARILVLGGDDPTNINTELNTVSLLLLLEGAEVGLCIQMLPPPSYYLNITYLVIVEFNGHRAEMISCGV